MRYKSLIALTCLLTLSGGMTACSGNISPNTYTSGEVGSESNVIAGVIVAKRSVKIDNSSKSGGYVGSAEGGTAGALLGLGFGNGLAGSVIGGVAGTVAGGLVGQGIDKAVNTHDGYEYIIKVQGGRTISVTQATDVNLAINQHVLVIQGRMTRVIPDESYRGK